MTPVMEGNGLCSYLWLKEGRVDLMDIATMHDQISVTRENERRYRRWAARNNGQSD